MENQHRKISGYRELSQVEIDLMNKIKAHAEITRGLVLEVWCYVNDQLMRCQDEAETKRLADANPSAWAGAAEHELQTAFMKLTRAVAQPTTF